MRRAWLLLAVALVVTACGDSDVEVANVGETAITLSELQTLRTSYQGIGTLTTSEPLRSDVSNLIIQRAAQDRLGDDFGLRITEDEIDAKLASLNPAEAAAIENFKQTPGNADVTDGYEREFARSFLIQGKVREALVSDPGLQFDILQNQPELVTSVCANHILVATQQEADDVMQRLGAGEVFAAIAADVSLDQVSPGGRLTCPAPATASASDRFVDAVMLAPVGEHFGPVETEFGWHVLLIDARETVTPEQFAADPVSVIDPDWLSRRFTEWFRTVLDDVEISVDERIGRWVPEAFGIAPPE